MFVLIITLSSTVRPSIPGQYWRQVPKTYEVAYLGKCGTDNSKDINKTISHDMPWCTTAMAFSLTGSQRLSRIMAHLINR